MNQRSAPIKYLAAFALAVLALVPAAQPRSALAIEREVIRRVYPAVVQLGMIAELTDASGTRVVSPALGSGTIVDPRGYILSTDHTAVLEGLEEKYRDDAGFRILETSRMVVFVARQADLPPIPAYLAEVRAASPELNLSVLQIVSDLSGDPVDPTTLDLPALSLGDSDQVELGDNLNIFGYPGIGGESINFASGHVAGFIAEPGAQGRGWIKTDAPAAAGSGGGAGVDDQGILVGVPAFVSSTLPGGEAAGCRPIGDANGDGAVDGQDPCVPAGGALKGLRPINLAKPLIAQALAGLGAGATPTATATAEPNAAPTAETPPGEAGPAVDNLFFSPGVTAEGEPISVVERLPSGSTALALFYDFRGFETGGTQVVRLFHDGELVDSGEKVWEVQLDGSFGRLWHGGDDFGFADGTYTYEIEYDGEILAEASIEVGGTEEPGHVFHSVTFAIEGDYSRVLKAGTTRLSGNFIAENMDVEDEWRYSWLKRTATGEWEEVTASSAGWGRVEAREGWAPLDSEAPLAPGRYRLNLYMGERYMATGDVTLVSQVGGDLGIGLIRFATEMGPDNKPVDPAYEFPEGTRVVYAFFDYAGLAAGTRFSYTWYLNGDEVLARELVLPAGGPTSGSTYLLMANMAGYELPPGLYELAIDIETRLVQRGSFRIAGDVAPTPTPEPEEGVLLTGVVLDADTGRPIPGAFLIVLAEGVTWDQYFDDPAADKVHEGVATDQDGRFETTLPLRRGGSYGIGVGVAGYEEVLFEEVEIADDTPDVVELEIRLARQR